MIILPFNKAEFENDSFEIAKKVLASQPFSRLLGAESIEFLSTKVEVIIPVTEDLKQQFGFVHGGARRDCQADEFK